MATHTKTSPHIRMDARGECYIDDTETKVVSVVRNKQMSGDSPEDLQMNMPHLSLAQIYAALAYYHDHKAQIDAHIIQLDKGAEALAGLQPHGPSRKELIARRQAIENAR